MRTIALLLPFICTVPSSAQWSTDPANPMAICNAANAQTAMHAIPDGASGWYCFWSDARVDASHPSLYGQHIDNAGNALWAMNGLLLQSVVDSSIFDSAPVLMADGSVILAYMYQGNNGYNGVVKALRIDATGAPLWADPVTLARSGNGPLGNIFYFSQPTIMRSGNEAYVAWDYTPQGGNDVDAWERVRLDGTTRFGSPGHAIPGSGWGPFSMHDDMKRGVIFDWRQGNGSGAPLQAMRVDSSGANVWSSVLNVSAGTTGLGYAFRTIGGPSGTCFSAWTTAGQDIGMTRYDTAGTVVWTPTPFYACNESHQQDNPCLLISGNSFFVGWGDNRPPAANQDMYVQKFDMNGAPQWSADGSLAMRFQTYIPYPDIVAGNNGSILATFDGTTSGFSAMRILDDGSHAWAAPVPFCNTSNLGPFYANRTVMPDGSGGVVAFWTTSGGDAYAARIYENGELGDHTGIEENSTTGTLELFPDPANDHITLRTRGNERIEFLQLIAPDGRVIIDHISGTSISMDVPVAHLPPGTYVVRTITSDGPRVARFIKQ